MQNIVDRAKKSAIKDFLDHRPARHPGRAPAGRVRRRVQGERGPAEHDQPGRLGADLRQEGRADRLHPHAHHRQAGHRARPRDRHGRQHRPVPLTAEPLPPPLHALELLPDEAGAASVRRSWTALHDAGLPSQLDHRGATNAVHVTVVAAPALTDEVVEAAARRLVPLLPLTVRLSGLLLLGGSRVTLARAVEVDDDTLRAVLDVRSLVPGRQHPGWLPHVTLARRLPRDRVQQAGRRRDVGRRGGHPRRAAAVGPRVGDRDARRVTSMKFGLQVRGSTGRVRRRTTARSSPTSRERPKTPGFSSLWVMDHFFQSRWSAARARHDGGVHRRWPTPQPSPNASSSAPS